VSEADKNWYQGQIQVFLQQYESAWESNPPMKLVTPPSRFEDEDSHRATSALAHILRMYHKVVKT